MYNKIKTKKGKTNKLFFIVIFIDLPITICLNNRSTISDWTEPIIISWSEEANRMLNIINSVTNKLLNTFFKTFFSCDQKII